MRAFLLLSLVCLSSLLPPIACVDQLDLNLRGTGNVVVVEGTITNRGEAQIIRFNRSRADSVTGPFGSSPLTKAQVSAVVYSLVTARHQTIDGTCQLSSDCGGQVGHAYPFRFPLSDSTPYQSTQQVMVDVPPLAKGTAQFNPEAISLTRYEESWSVLERG